MILTDMMMMDQTLDDVSNCDYAVDLNFYLEVNYESFAY